MPSVTFNKQAFLKAVGKKLPDKVLAERMALLGTDVGEITATSVTVEVFPNRPDLLSMQGFARALRGFIGIDRTMRKYSVKKGKTVVTIANNLKTVRPYTACAIVHKLKLDEEKLKSIIEIQEKLHVTYGRKRKRCAIGIYPLNNISPPISFEARAPKDIVFTPLDGKKPEPALQILKDHPKGKEYAHLLFNLREFPVFVDSTGLIMSLVPIINSELTGRVTPQTKDIFVEVSGHDFSVCHKALIIICAALADMGGEIESCELRYGTKKIHTPDFTPEKRTITSAIVNKTLGTSLSQAEVGTSLRRMGYEVKGSKIGIPAWRTDILHDVDIIEDVAIGYGYEKLTPTFPNISTIGSESKGAKLERVLRSIMIGMGFLEVRTFCLSSPKIQQDNVRQIRRLVEMENPLTADYSVLRHMLIPNLLETLSKNRHNEYPQQLFEIGAVWTPDEEPRLSFVICAEKNAGFTEAKQVLEALHRALGKELHLKPYEDRLFISGRGAVFPGGYFGELHPQVLTNFELPFAVVAAEIRFREILE